MGNLSTSSTLMGAGGEQEASYECVCPQDFQKKSKLRKRNGDSPNINTKT
jgi:hypothetical protein